MDTKNENGQPETGVSMEQSNSWVFVNANKEPQETESVEKDISNKFYLSCAEEPVQELSENELGKIQSDGDSDTDGISVISESENADSRSEEESCSTPKLQSIREKDEFEEVLEDSKTDFINEDIETLQNNDQGYKGNLLSIKNYFSLHSILGTSVIVLAVLLSPYFASNNTTEDELGGLKSIKFENEYDFANTLTDKNVPKNVDDVDPVLYCKEIHKNDDIYMHNNVRKCLKKMLKHMKKLKRHGDKAKEKQIKKQMNVIENEMIERKSNIQVNNHFENIISEDQEIEINYKKSYRKEGKKEFKHEKFLKKYKYDNMNKDKNDKVNVYEKNKEYKYENIKSKDEDENHWKFDTSETNKNKLSLSEFELNLATKEVKLNEKEIYLLEKEQHLKEREYNLIQKELKLKQESNQTKDENYKKHMKNGQKFATGKYEVPKKKNKKHRKIKNSDFIDDDITVTTSEENDQEQSETENKNTKKLNTKREHKLKAFKNNMSNIQSKNSDTSKPVLKNKYLKNATFSRENKTNKVDNIEKNITFNVKNSENKGNQIWYKDNWYFRYMGNREKIRYRQKKFI